MSTTRCSMGPILCQIAGKQSRPGCPKAAGYLPAMIWRYALLQSTVGLTPQQTRMERRMLRQTLTRRHKPWGQILMGPKKGDARSKERMNSSISPSVGKAIKSVALTGCSFREGSLFLVTGLREAFSLSLRACYITFPETALCTKMRRSGARLTPVAHYTQVSLEIKLFFIGRSSIWREYRKGTRHGRNVWSLASVSIYIVKRV